MDTATLFLLLHGNSLPPGYIWRVGADGIDTVGLSASDYLLIRSELRSIFFSDASTKRDNEDIITLIEASPYLNNGWELVGSASMGYALYVEGTSQSILNKAYRYFNETYSLLYPDDLISLYDPLSSYSGAVSFVGPTPSFPGNLSLPDSSGVIQTAKFITHAGKGLMTMGGYTQSLTNSSAGGAVVGSPGTLPTGWTKSDGNGVALSVVGVGAGYVDLRFSGTATATISLAVRCNATINTAGVAGEKWTASALVTSVAGPSPTCTIGIFERSAAGGYLIDSSSSLTLGVLSSHTRTLTHASTANVQHSITFGNVALGASVDFTVRITTPQLSKTAYLMPFVSTAGAAITVPATSGDDDPDTGASFVLDSEILTALKGTGPEQTVSRMFHGATEGNTVEFTAEAHFINSPTNPMDTFEFFTDRDGKLGVHCANDGSTAAYAGTANMVPVVAGRTYEITGLADVAMGTPFLTAATGIPGTYRASSSGTDYEASILMSGYFRWFFTPTITETINILFRISPLAYPVDYSISGLKVREIIPTVKPAVITNTLCCWGDSTSAGRFPAFMRNFVQYGNVYNGGVGGETSTQIKARFLAAGAEKLASRTIIWAGANNVSSAPATVISDIAEMVAALTTDDYLVMAPLGNAANSAIGTVYRDNINTVRASLLATYGSKFVDIEQVVIAAYDPAIPQDVIDYGNGVTPSSLRADNIHLSYDGYDLVVGHLTANYPDFFVYPAPSTSTFTIAASVYMGASSAEITADTNILSLNDTITGGIYAASGGVLKVSDGANTATVTVSGGWARGETILIAAGTNEAGTNLQIGYKKSAESAITKGTAANYDGSMSPGTDIRLAFTGIPPVYYRGHFISGLGGLSDSEILSRSSVFV